MAVQWEATDQFGNLFVAASTAGSVEELAADVGSLISELRSAGRSGVVSFDFEYCEINGPDPESVSHVLQVPWLADCDPEGLVGAIQGMLAESADGFELSVLEV